MSKYETLWYSEFNALQAVPVFIIFLVKLSTKKEIAFQKVQGGTPNAIVLATSAIHVSW